MGIRCSPPVFACQSIGNGAGAGQLLGGLIGSLIMHLSGEQYRLLFGLSLVGRVAVALVMPRAHVEGSHRGRLLLWVIGYRPDSGLNHRPVPEPTKQEDAAAGGRPDPSRG